MSARKYLNETGLASLWTKIVNKINALGDLCVKKAGDIMTGDLTIAGRDLILGTKSSSTDDSGDIVWQYGNGNEKARLWTDTNPITAENGRLNFRVYDDNGTQLSAVKLATDSDVNTKLSKTGDKASGLMTFAQGIQIQAGSQGTNPPFFLCLLNPFAQGGDVGWTNSSDMAAAIGLSTTIKNKTVTDASSLHNLPSYSADNIPTTKYMAYWNGAYNSSGNSNLRYTAAGALGTAATMNKGALDACDSSVTNVVPRVSGTNTISRIDPGTLRTKMVGWNNAITFDCRWDTVALGIVIANSADSYAMYYVRKPTNGNWVYVYNSAISNVSSTYPQMTTSTFKSGGIQYARATFRGRNNTSWTYWAIWGVSNEASH